MELETALTEFFEMRPILAQARMGTYFIIPLRYEAGALRHDRNRCGTTATLSTYGSRSAQPFLSETEKAVMPGAVSPPNSAWHNASASI